MAEIFAQAAGGPNDPIAPWLQLVMQGGALGVLILLSVQLPRLARVLKEWRNEAEQSHREERKQIMADHKEALLQQRADNKDALQAVLNHADEWAGRHDVSISSLQGEVENLQEMMEDFRTGRPLRPRKPRPPAGHDP